MNAAEKALTRRWIKAWDLAEERIETIKAATLQAPDYYRRNIAALNGLLAYAADHAVVRTTTGLVEFQKHRRALRRTRAGFVARFSERPYYFVRAATPQVLMDEVDKVI